MKKVLLCSYFLFLVVNVFSQHNFNNFKDREKSRTYTIKDMNYHITYEAIRDTKSVRMKNYDYEDGVNIKKGEKFTVCYDNDAFESILYYDKYGLLVTNQSTSEDLIIPFKDLGLPKKTRLPEVISSNKWCLNYHYDVIKSNNRETLGEYEWWINCYDEKLRSYFNRDSEGNVRDYKWYEIYETIPEIIITDSCISIYGFFYHYQAQGFVIDIDENVIKVVWALSLFDRCFNDEFDSIKTSYESNIEYELDGDYLNLIIDGYKISLAKKCTNFDSEWTAILNKNKCDLSKVTFPRHADGSCDYDGSKKTVASQAQKATSPTNVAPNKTMTVRENLKLRSGEDTSSQVLAVMQAGAKVRILELGKAETIDGIASNWVKVEVQQGAKDRDGKAVKKGTVGWCFGGYLE